MSLKNLPKLHLLNDNNSGSGSGNVVIDEEVYIPGRGLVLLSTLGPELAEELERMYERGELDEEVYAAIQAYYHQIAPKPDKENDSE